VGASHVRQRHEPVFWLFLRYYDAGPRVTPEQAQQVSPEVISQLAEHAAKQDPSIIDRAGEFYSQHPTLVKSLGVGALTVIMSHLSQRH
jgi:hypothetical protein